MAFEDEPQWAVVTQLRAVNDVTARDTHGEIPANEEVVVLVVARCEPRRVLVSDRQSTLEQRLLLPGEHLYEW